MIISKGDITKTAGVGAVPRGAALSHGRAAARLGAVHCAASLSPVRASVVPGMVRRGSVVSHGRAAGAHVPDSGRGPLEIQKCISNSLKKSLDRLFKKPNKVPAPVQMKSNKNRTQIKGNKK